MHTCFFPEYECSSTGVVLLTDKFDLMKEVEKAKPLIRDIFLKATLDPNNEGALGIRKNTTFLLNWLCDTYYAKYEEKIGFSQKTCLQSMWPGTIERNMLCKKIEKIAPGLTRKWDEKSKEFIDQPIKERILRRFQTDNMNRKNALKVPKGKQFSSSENMN